MKVFHQKKRLAVGVLAAAMLGSVLGLAPAAHAATWNVKCDTDKLIQAITLSNTNDQADTINLAKKCTYELDWANNNLPAVGPTGLPLIVNDVGGHDLTINGNGAKIKRDEDGQDFRILGIFPDASVIIKDLTVSNGFLPSVSNMDVGGAGIAMGPGSSLTATGLKVLDNELLTVSENSVPSNFAGGIHCVECAALSLNKSTVAGNDVTAISFDGDPVAAAGGIYSDGDAVTIRKSSVKGNGAHARGTTGSDAWAGGIYQDGGDLTVTDSSLTKNLAEARSNTSAATQGGAVVADGSTFTLTDSKVSGNTATAEDAVAQGGGLALIDATTTIVESEITKNTAKAAGSGSMAQGGGIYKDGGSLTVDDPLEDDESSEVSKNTASAKGFGSLAQGGGYYGDSAEFNFTEFEKNKATSPEGAARGGGLYVSAGTVDLNDAEVTKNEASGFVASGGGVYGAAGSTVNLGFSEIEDNKPDDCAGTATC